MIPTSAQKLGQSPEESVPAREAQDKSAVTLLRWQAMNVLGCSCETNHATRYDEVSTAECQAEAEMIFKAEQELVELRWNMQKARSTAEQQVEALMREVEALKKSEPELAQEIAEAVEEAQTLQAAEKAEASAVEKAAQERHAEVAAFLKKHGFRSINEAKRSFLSSSYALHRAVKLGDARMVELLLLDGALKEQKESGLLSSGKTAMQLAKNGKYANPAVLRVLSDMENRSKGA